MRQQWFYCALRSALLYALFAGLWILFSDAVLLLVVKNPQRLTELQSIKGLCFVAISSLLLFFSFATT